MSPEEMTPMQRVLCTLGFNEPDRVPFFLLLTMHGAKELGLSIKEYFSRPEYVVEGQLRMLEKYRHDCVNNFYYGAVDVEAWGSEVIYYDDGPPNAGAPFIRKPEDIKGLQPPKIEETPCLLKVLESAEMLKEAVADRVPITGTIISPFSLPIMQMGFDKYMELIYERPGMFRRLMKVNEAFCVQWANAQLNAGASFICYFDPMSSPTMIPREKFLETGYRVARRTLARIKGPTAIHFASGACLPIIEDVIRTGTAVVGPSTMEDLGAVKTACRNKLTILGNLNGIEMRRWTADQTEKIVKEAIAKAGRGGGFILADNHGEIPFQVPDDVLTAISEAVFRWGRYPLSPEMEQRG